MCFLVFPELRWPGATIEGFAGSAEDSRFVLDAADFETYDSVGVSECLRSIHLRIPHRGMGKVSARSVLDVPVQVSDDGSWRAFAVYCNGDAGGGGEADEHEPAPLGVSTAAGDADNGLRDHVAGLSVAPPEDRGSWRILGDRRRGCRPSPAEEDDDAQQHGDFDDGSKVHFDNDGVILYEGGGTEIHSGRRTYPYDHAAQRNGCRTSRSACQLSHHAPEESQQQNHDLSRLGRW